MDILHEVWPGANSCRIIQIPRGKFVFMGGRCFGLVLSIKKTFESYYRKVHDNLGRSQGNFRHQFFSTMRKDFHDGDGFFSQQDLVPCHTSREMLNFFENKNKRLF